MPDQNGDCEIRFRVPAIVFNQLNEMASLSGIGSQDFARRIFYVGLTQMDFESKRAFIIKSIREGREVKW